MPVYEYQCKKCGNVFSVLQSLSAAKTCVACDKCGSCDTVKIISRFGSKASDTTCRPSGPFT